MDTGTQNNTADALSRGRIPSWLKRLGTEYSTDLNKLAFRMRNAEQSWDEILR